ncbi:hypothetical protein EJI01_05285 [Variovorax sp. MHTC-1]|nr:hypothetical protein EJI01_05285 [Variovorax sp. MHTC-1]
MPEVDSDEEVTPSRLKSSAWAPSAGAVGAGAGAGAGGGAGAGAGAGAAAVSVAWPPEPPPEPPPQAVSAALPDATPIVASAHIRRNRLRRSFSSASAALSESLFM